LRRALAQVATELPHDGNLLVDSMGSILTQIFLISATVILPITFVVGMLATHRLAGPLYRFKMYLNSVVRGEKPADCKLRRGDELQDLCELINLATAETRKVSSASAAEQSSAKPSNLRAAG
jgi:signal transduction histidine kinase